MEKVKNCPLCKSMKFKLKYNLSEQYKYDKCKNCGLVFMNPRLKDEMLIKHYKDFNENHAMGFEKINEENRYISLLQKNLESIDFFNFEKQLLKPAVLDIGCGTGIILKYFENRNWETYGLDTNSLFIKIAKSNNSGIFFNTTIEDFKIDMKFDLVLLINFLEHIVDPIKILRKIKTFLKPNGHIYIWTPNIKALNISKKWISFPPNMSSYDHIIFFSPKTIKILCEKCDCVLNNYVTWGCIRKDSKYRIIASIMNQIVKKLDKGEFMFLDLKI